MTDDDRTAPWPIQRAEQRHPHPGGWLVGCTECDDDNLFHSLWYDVAERYADAHEDTRGHHTYVAEVVPDDGP